MNISFLHRMLDEIERLRGVLGQEHAGTCALLRTDAPCDCGCTSQAASTLLECTSLRAQVSQLQQMIMRSRMELARLDATLAAERAERAMLLVLDEDRKKLALAG